MINSRTLIAPPLCPAWCTTAHEVLENDPGCYDHRAHVGTIGALGDYIGEVRVSVVQWQEDRRLDTANVLVENPVGGCLSTEDVLRLTTLLTHAAAIASTQAHVIEPREQAATR